MRRATHLFTAAALAVALLVGMVAAPALAGDEPTKAPPVRTHDDKDRSKHHPRLVAFALARCLGTRHANYGKDDKVRWGKHGTDGNVGVTVFLKTGDRAPAFRGLVKVDGLRPRFVTLAAGGDTEREFFVVPGAGDGRRIHWAVFGKFSWRERIALPYELKSEPKTEPKSEPKTEPKSEPPAPVEDPPALVEDPPPVPVEEAAPTVVQASVTEPKSDHHQPRMIERERSQFVKRFGVVRVLCAKPKVWAKTWCDHKRGKQLVAWTIANPTGHPMVIAFTNPRLGLHGTVVGPWGKVTRVQQVDGKAKTARLLVAAAFDRHGRHLRFAQGFLRLPGDCKCRDRQVQLPPGKGHGKPHGGSPGKVGGPVLIAAPAAALQADTAEVAGTDEGALPFTGSSSELLAAFGMALVLVGASVLGVRRFTRR